MVKFLRNRLVFYGQAFKQSAEVGAFSHTSRAVADAVAAPIVRRGAPLRVLEAGPGTGALTDAIVERLGPGDRLHLVEINPEFAKILRETYGRLDTPEVLVEQGDILRLPADARYDNIVSSLPILNMDPDKVGAIFELFMDRLAPDGTLSYYDYWAKEFKQYLVGGRERRRVKEVIRVTEGILDRYQVRVKTIPWNFLPARVHYLRKA